MIKANLRHRITLIKIKKAYMSLVEPDLYRLDVYRVTRLSVRVLYVYFKIKNFF